MSKRIDDILDLIDSVVPVEHRYTCDCGQEHVLRPNTSMIARVECKCGSRCDFNLR